VSVVALCLKQTHPSSIPTMRVELAFHNLLCIGGLDENHFGSAPYLYPAAPRTRG
jgi:hypothetical protein